MIAVIWTLSLIGIGIVIKWRGMYDEWRTMELSWDINSVGSYVAHRELLKVTGTAFVVSEIIMAASSCILKAFEVLYKKAALAKVSDESIRTALSPFDLAAISGKRFLPISSIDLTHKALKVLVITGVLWYKKENNTVFFGQNRKFDGLTRR